MKSTFNGFLTEMMGWSVAEITSCLYIKTMFPFNLEYWQRLGKYCGAIHLDFKEEFLIMNSALGFSVVLSG